jgi:hypothetical protein
MIAWNNVGAAPSNAKRAGGDDYAGTNSAGAVTTSACSRPTSQRTVAAPESRA